MFSSLISIVLLTVVILTGSSIAHANIPRQTIVEHLKHPSFQTRVDRIRREGDQGLRGLRDVAFDSKSSEPMKWNAVVSMGVVYGHRADSDLEKALKSDDWILRNAGLIALKSYNPVRSKEWSLKLLNDKALVVRSSSVAALAQDLDDRTIGSLWDAFNDPKNFRGSRSLWIRKQILHVVGAQPRHSDTERFVNVLKDRDSDLYPPAVKALERITGLRKGSADATAREQSRLWIKWWSTQKI